MARENRSIPDGDEALLDHYAGQALQGYLANPNGDWHDTDALARTCFRAAESMMKERAKRTQRALTERAMRIKPLILWKTKFIEVTNSQQNWGKFMLARFTPEEWARRSAIDPPSSLVRGRGWTPEHILVFDLQTGEGAMFRPGGSAHADLDKHCIWVCPMFEPFLEWLYGQELDDLDALPTMVDLPDAPFAFAGYRRAGGATQTP